jgi:hypothetical protein
MRRDRRQPTSSDVGKATNDVARLPKAVPGWRNRLVIRGLRGRFRVSFVQEIKLYFQKILVA